MMRFLVVILTLLAATFANAQEIRSPSSVNLLPYRTGLTVGCFGDSICSIGTNAVPVGSTYYQSAGFTTGCGTSSIICALQVASGGALTTNMVTFGYAGSYGAIRNYYVATAGACSGSSITMSVSAPGGSPANQAANFTVPIVNGAAVLYSSIPYTGTNGGSGYTGEPTYSLVSGTCSTLPTFAAVILGFGDWGIPGDNSFQAAARIWTDPCQNPVDWLVVNIGDNDFGTTITEAQTIANTATIVAAAQACGMRVVLLGAPPRLISGTWILAYDQERLRVNRARWVLAQQSIALNPGRPIIYVDVDKYAVDPTQSGATAGQAASYWTFDGAHQGIAGGTYDAMDIWDTIKGQAVDTLTNYPNSQNDVYNATNNPTGNLFGTTGLMLGTGGTVNSPCTGVAPTSWTLSATGTGTISCVGSIETTRTDGLLGQRWVVTYSATGGSASNSITITNSLNIVANITRGTDVLQAAVGLDISNNLNSLFVGCEIFEGGGTVNQTNAFQAFGSYAAGYPMISSATLADLQIAKWLPDYGLTSAGSYRSFCQLQPLPLQAGTSYQTFSVQAVGNATSSWTLTLKLDEGTLRKVNVQ